MSTLTNSQIDEFYNSFLELHCENAIELCNVNMEMASLLFMEALNEGTTVNDIAAQFLYATGAAQTLGFDIWTNKIELLDEKFGLDGKNILGVAEDPFPVLASLIAQRFSKSHIEALGPNIVSDWYQNPNFRTTSRRIVADKKDDIYTNLDKFDLIYGVHPCEGTVPLIRCASYHKKDYAIWLCDCIHSNGKSKTYKDWTNYVINLAKGLAPNTKCIEVLSHMIGDVEAPIIISKPKTKALVPGKTFR